MEISLLEFFKMSLIFVLVFGLAWSIWTTLRHYRTNEQPIRFSRMLRHLGIELKNSSGLDLEHHLPTAIRACQRCKSKEECDAWLTQNQHADLAPDFCVNASYLSLVNQNP